MGTHMKNLTLQKARNAFHRSQTQKVYLRKAEIDSIKEFLASKKSILSISGNPGTGKTFVVLHTVDRARSTYLNFFTEPKIFPRVRSSKSLYFIIDEFDKYELEKPKECQKLLSYILEHNKKLITISNHLRNAENTLFFKPYSSEEIEKIVTLKLQNEVGEDILDLCKIKLLSKKVSTGDVRQVYEQCIKMINQDDVENVENSKDHASIHRRIIEELVEDVSSREKNEVFSKYLDRCKELQIPAFERSDFSCLYDLLE